MPNLSAPLNAGAKGQFGEANIKRNCPIFCAETVDKHTKTVVGSGKLPKKTTPKLKVSKEGFDKVLVKLIQTKPQKRRNSEK